MAHVKLLVYDLTNDYPLAKELFNFLPGSELNGIWHSSITVHGREIDYGQRGVKIQPEGEVKEKPRHTIRLGVTKYSLSTILLFARILERNQFRKENYNVINNNCHCFTNTLVKNILKIEIPKFLRSLPNNVCAAVIGKLFVTGSHTIPASKNIGAPQLYAASKPICKGVIEEENGKL